MTDQLQQLQQQGYVVFQLLSAVEAFEVRALVQSEL